VADEHHGGPHEVAGVLEFGGQDHHQVLEPLLGVGDPAGDTRDGRPVARLEGDRRWDVRVDLLAGSPWTAARWPQADSFERIRWSNDHRPASLKT